jgi:hypothetical protein
MQVRSCTMNKGRWADRFPGSGMRYSSSGLYRRRRNFLFLRQVGDRPSRPRRRGGQADPAHHDVSHKLGVQTSADPIVGSAYEMWSWGVHVCALDVVPAYVRLTCLNRNTWEQVWDMVVRVDRPNFGINLDTFQILGATLRHHISTRYSRPIPARAWADIVFPSSSDRTLRDADQVLHTSLTKLTSTLSDPKAREKIVYLQISDGSKHVKAEDLVKSAAEVRDHSTTQFDVRFP